MMHSHLALPPVYSLSVSLLQNVKNLRNENEDNNLKNVQREGI